MEAAPSQGARTSSPRDHRVRKVANLATGHGNRRSSGQPMARVRLLERRPDSLGSNPRSAQRLLERPGVLAVFRLSK